MKHRILGSTLIFAFASAGAMAEESSLFGVPTTYSIGLETYQQTFKMSDSEGSISEKSMLYGVTGDIRMKFTDTQAMKLSTRFAMGNNGHIRGRIGDLSDEMGNGSLNEFDVRGVYQYTLNAAGQPLTASAGLGYRNHTSTFGDSTEYGDAVSNKSTYTYATLGVESTFALSDKVSFTPKLNYNQVLKASQTLNLGWGDYSYQPKSGNGIEMAGEFKTKLAGNTLSVTPFYRVWNIKSGESDNNKGKIPGQKSTEAGLNVSLAF
jgi:hypothetical protein